MSMKRTPWIWLAVLATLTLSACVRRADAAPPIVTVTSPQCGAVRTADAVVVNGYAFADEGVKAIRVIPPDGAARDLMADAIYTTDRGKRLVPFAFRAGQLSDGSWAAAIEVEDVRGLSSRLDCSLQIDNNPPTLELNPLEAVSSTLVRVSGVARDNQQLASIRINDVNVPVGQQQERPFTVEVALRAGETATVTVVDQAGNQIQQQQTR
jgi:hypothetical protein